VIRIGTIEKMTLWVIRNAITQILTEPVLWYAVSHAIHCSWRTCAIEAGAIVGSSMLIIVCSCGIGTSIDEAIASVEIEELAIEIKSCGPQIEVSLIGYPKAPVTVPVLQINEHGIRPAGSIAIFKFTWWTWGIVAAAVVGCCNRIIVGGHGIGASGNRAIAAVVIVDITIIVGSAQSAIVANAISDERSGPAISVTVNYHPRRTISAIAVVPVEFGTHKI
jgi:hypothetical protein